MGEVASDKKHNRWIWPLIIALVAIFGVLCLQIYYPIKPLTLFFTIIDNYITNILKSWPAVVLIIGIILLFKYRGAVDYFIRKRFEGFGPLRAGGSGEEQKESISSIKKPDLENEKAKIKFFERTYGLIYGSQINILLKLNSSSEGIKTSEAAQFYLDSAYKYPQIRSYRFDQYINFLVVFGLINLVGEINNGTIFITTIGKEFLEYITQESLMTLLPRAF